jgi:imidazolonepropionase-like amidohydrolase
VTAVDTIAAIEAGVTALAHTPHTYPLTEQEKQTIARAGIPMSSTLGIYVPAFNDQNEKLFRDRLPFPVETLTSAGQGPVNARYLWDGGLVYGYGTDTSWTPKDALAHELRALALVFSPKDIVSILTRNAAAVIGRADQLGVLEPGKLADIVVLDGNPLENVSSFLNVTMVLKGGVVVLDKR